LKVGEKSDILQGINAENVQEETKSPAFKV